jgi:hypothetical protein
LSSKQSKLLAPSRAVFQRCSPWLRSPHPACAGLRSSPPPPLMYTHLSGGSPCYIDSVHTLSRALLGAPWLRSPHPALRPGSGLLRHPHSCTLSPANLRFAASGFPSWLGGRFFPVRTSGRRVGRVKEAAKRGDLPVREAERRKMRGKWGKIRLLSPFLQAGV